MVDFNALLGERDYVRGVVKMAGGEIGYTSVSRTDEDMYAVRYESSWYCHFTNDGVLPIAGVIHKRDGSKEDVPGRPERYIVEFEEMSWSEAELRYPGIQSGFHP